MLKFRNFVQQLEGTNVRDASVETDVRESVLAAMSKIQQLHADILNDKLAPRGNAQLSAAITELASLTCLMLGILLSDRTVILRGSGAV